MPAHVKPRGQVDCCPLIEKNPGGTATCVVGPDRKKPGSTLMHDVALEAFWYSSSPHGEHLVDAFNFAAYLPGEQSMHAMDP